MKKVKRSNKDNCSGNLIFKQKPHELKGKIIKIFKEFTF